MGSSKIHRMEWKEGLQEGIFLCLSGFLCYLWMAGILHLASEVYQQTIIMVTHDLQMAEYADRIIKIADGVVQR